MNYPALADAIAGWLRAYACEAGAGGYVVGLSGGVDSAVTAALAARAMGTDHVLGVLMPCHSQPVDAEYAHMLADALALPTLTVDLGAPFDALMAALPQDAEPSERQSMARANVKPRLRMITLYYLAQSHGYLVAGTGNKPEMMVGYFTKYGDGGVDLEPLGELHKHEVRGLARALDVPEPIIARAPTAGLWPGQTDEGELGITYAELDAILAALEAGRAPAAPAETVARVQRMVVTTAHKRAMPPAFPVQRKENNP